MRNLRYGPGLAIVALFGFSLALLPFACETSPMPATHTTNKIQSTRAKNFDEHVPFSLGGSLKDGAPIISGDTYKEYFSCAGSSRIRVRFKATKAGTLRLRFVRNDATTPFEYPTNQPADAAVVADVESVIDVTAHMGEARGYVSFTPSAGPGFITYCDVLQT